MNKNNLKLDAVILARGNSKAIKNKNLVSINNKPLLYWSIKDCLECERIKNVWISSDSKKILNYAKKQGARIIKRPPHLCLDNSSSESGWLHAIKKIENEYKINNLILLQATSPIRGAKDLNRSIIYFFKNKFDSLFSSNKVINYYNWEKKRNLMKPLFEKRLMRQKIQPQFNENGSFWIVNVEKFKKFKKRTFGKIGAFEQEFFKSFELDEKEDILFISTLLKIYKKKL